MFFSVHIGTFCIRILSDLFGLSESSTESTSDTGGGDTWILCADRDFDGMMKILY